MIFSLLFLTDIQSIRCQTSQYLTKSQLHNFDSVKGLIVNLDLSKSETRNFPSILVAQPISRTNKELSKINSSNWVRYDKEEISLQRLNFPTQQQVYIRFDQISLDQNEYLEVYNLTTGERIDLISFKTKKYLGGPYNSEEIGLLLNSKEETAIQDITIGEIYVGAMDFGFDSSFECHHNVNCDEGIEFSVQKRGVARITMVLEEGIGFCTGSLINNVQNDRTPFLLSAYHCQDGFTPLYDMWSFDFGYESFSCANPETEPSFVKVTGCERVAGHQNTDMLLLKITSEVPVSANAYLTGWNRDDTYNPDRVVLIHHPRGDIKKVTVDNDEVLPYSETLNWDNGIQTSANSHSVTRFDGGTYQGGSSGAPLIDYNGSIVGQLHGGPEDDELCSVGIGYHGRISQSWEGGGTSDSRLRDWLDPNSTGATMIPGFEINNEESSFITFEGRLVTPDGIAIPNVEVSIKGDKEETFQTGSDGRFVFDNLQKRGQYTLSFTKNNNHGNGVSGIDLVQIMNHIIGNEPLRGVFQQRSADANNDGQVSSLDLVQILNIIIGRAEIFPQNTSWKFEPSIIQMDSSTVAGESQDKQIIGYKIGDVNFSANPRK